MTDLASWAMASRMTLVVAASVVRYVVPSIVNVAVLLCVMLII